jgi:hypothetical protein
MQATISRQNHFQNLFSLAIFMLIIGYYAFNNIPQDTVESKQLLIENTEQNKIIELEKSVSQLRAAILMDADAVQINGLLYEVENALGNFIEKKEAKIIIQSIDEKIHLNDKKKAIRLINQLLTLLLYQKQS